MCTDFLNPKLLATANPSDTSTAMLYTVGTNRYISVAGLRLIPLTTANVTYSVIVNTGGSDRYLVYNETLRYALGAKDILQTYLFGSGDIIKISVSVASSVQFILSGTESQ